MKEENELAKWLAGEMSEDELRAFSQTPEFATYEKIVRFSAELKAPEFNSEILYSNVISQPKKSVKVIPMRTWFLRVAAILVIGLGLLFGMQHFAVKTEMAQNGQTTTFSLPDNSEVVLNSNSQINYKKWNWNSKRALDLSGEAFFKVSKGKTFDVNTTLGKVTVVGTQFSVKSRNDRFEVECFEGKVLVAPVKGGEASLITKGQIIVIDNGKIIVASATNTDKPLWLNNEIRIISLSLNEIIGEIERDYNVSIEPEMESAQKFTGILPKDNLKTALTIVGESYGFNFEMKDKNKVLLTRK